MHGNGPGGEKDHEIFQFYSSLVAHQSADQQPNWLLDERSWFQTAAACAVTSCAFQLAEACA
jgi:hypothetical protein